MSRPPIEGVPTPGPVPASIMGGYQRPPTNPNPTVSSRTNPAVLIVNDKRTLGGYGAVRASASGASGVTPEMQSNPVRLLQTTGGAFVPVPNTSVLAKAPYGTVSGTPAVAFLGPPTSAPAPTPAATVGASAVTSKAQYPSTGGVTTPDQGGGVGGVSPATNTRSGSTVSLWRLLGLAALAFLILYLLKSGALKGKSGALKGAGKRRRKQ